MRTWLSGRLSAAVVILGLTAVPALAQPRRGNPQDEQAIAKNGEAFIEAFHNGDARALAAFWTVDGDYTDQTGRSMNGRPAIEKAFTGFFAENKGLRLQIQSESLRFLTADVAVEDGMTAVLPPDGGPPSRARYTIVHVKKDGKWMLGSVRDAPFAAPTNYDNLRELEWAVGDWAPEAASGEVARLSFAWSENQGFLIGTFSTTFKNIILTSGTQWIGWDPIAKRIRSWVFDTNGGFGEGAWAREGNRWTVKTTVVLPDGKKLASTNVITRVDTDTATWQSKERTLDGKSLADVKEITLKRVK